jgi:hypothetical protein
MGNSVIIIIIIIIIIITISSSGSSEDRTSIPVLDPSGSSVKLIRQLHLVSRIRVGGAIPLLHLSDFMVCKDFIIILIIIIAPMIKQA